MGLWRCLNQECSEDRHGRCVFDFEADVPVCPKCGADRRKLDEENMIDKRSTIHFDPPHEKYAGRSQHKCACNGKSVFLSGIMATGEARQVNCRACMATAAWKQAAEDQGTDVIVEPAGDFVIGSVDAENLLIRVKE